jgi:ABC-2 type transport system ATP-binding protein
MADTVVEVKNLTKRYDNVVAVDRVSFEIYQGEILGLLGPNGAGKTTTIQMLLGLLIPTSGEIRILGMDLARHREEILNQVNFSSAYVAMPYSLTVIENLMVFARLYGIKKPREKIEALLKTFEMETMRTKVTGSLSSGQVTRLCLAKALLNDPKILFLDEPTVSLDPDIADKTRSLLKDLRNRASLTILYTSHNMREMEEMCDRILFLNKGRLIAAGTPRELLKKFGKENLEEVFLKVAREREGEGRKEAP